MSTGTKTIRSELNSETARNNYDKYYRGMDCLSSSYNSGSKTKPIVSIKKSYILRYMKVLS